ncbi:hypothetical protein [Peribacillus loiseleuriae]|uniref:hypothetical protein n=1 Tax=Peribacillus loiseleuriae TaxID=1679170 RepID=UPI003CFDE40E
MKKKITNALLAIMLVAPVAVVGVSGDKVEASTSTQQKVMWGSNELYANQIGRIVFLKDTKLYKRDSNNVPSFHLNAKKGSMWRVYKITNEGGKNIYDLGGGVRVQQSNLSTIEYVPSSLKQKFDTDVAKISTKVYDSYYGGMEYFQVGLSNKFSEDKINKALLEDVKYQERERNLWTINTYDFNIEYKVEENKNGRLKILATISNKLVVQNIPVLYHYTMTFDLNTGDLLSKTDSGIVKQQDSLN